jgi:hypothetical protein
MKNLLLALALVATTPVCGFAGDIANHAAAAEKALDSGDGLAAIQTQRRTRCGPPCR